jgi:AraC-like DNA-binding protein
MELRTSLNLFYETTAIPICITSESSLLFSQPAFDGPVFPNQFIQYVLRDFKLQQRDETHPLVLMTEPAYFIGVAKLADRQYLILGPAGSRPHSQHEILELCKHVIYPDKLLFFCEVLNRAPVVSYRRFISMLVMAVGLVSGRAISLEAVVLSNNTVQKHDVGQKMANELFSQREHSIAHTPESFETGVLTAVQAGDAETLKRRLLEPVTGRVGQMSKDMLTQEKYTFVSFITMVTRAAIRGGLAQETAYTLSDTYCQQMDDLTRPQDIASLTFDMVLDFCQKVAREGNRQQFSPPVETCRRYISQHLHEDVRLPDLAAASGLCTRVISQKLREETGFPVTVYIHRQKMQEAKYLLKHSKHSIADIGEYLSYNSQSYFTKVYRDVYGITPQQYRDRCSES